jgi:hypothetical protein
VGYIKLCSRLGKITYNFQNAFIRGRQILDVILVANECFCHIFNSGWLHLQPKWKPSVSWLDCHIRSREPEVLCKLDLEKVYDHVKWESFLYLLKRCGSKEKLRDWIACCILRCDFPFLLMVDHLDSLVVIMN